MGAPKQKWTAEEEEALRAGISKHGAGRWRTIQQDPEFSRCLATRSNIDLKDKWRNMSVSAGGQGGRDKSKVPKLKGPSASSSLGHVVSVPRKEGALQAVVDSIKNLQDGKAPPRYTTMIIEALTVMQEPNGTDAAAIYKFIEQRHEVPVNFRRLLSSKLRRLVLQNKIEKAPKGYRLKEFSSFATKTPTPKQKDPVYCSKLLHNTMLTSSAKLLEEVAISAAYKIADAEAKSFLASEAVKEAEKISRMAEETDSLLLLAKELFERCSRGEIVTVT